MMKFEYEAKQYDRINSMINNDAMSNLKLTNNESEELTENRNKNTMKCLIKFKRLT